MALESATEASYSEWTKDRVNSLQIDSFQGLVHIVDSRDPQIASEQEAEALRFISQERVLGFDTETKPCFKKGRQHRTALVQLASTSHAVLYRVFMCSVPPGLRRILEDGSIIKVGQGVESDANQLER